MTETPGKPSQSMSEWRKESIQTAELFRELRSEAVNLLEKYGTPQKLKGIGGAIALIQGVLHKIPRENATTRTVIDTFIPPDPSLGEVNPTHILMSTVGVGSPSDARAVKIWAAEDDKWITSQAEKYFYMSATLELDQDGKASATYGGTTKASAVRVGLNHAHGYGEIVRRLRNQLEPSTASDSAPASETNPTLD